MDVVYVCETVQEAQEAFGQILIKLPKKYLSCRMSVDEILSSDNLPYALVVLVTPSFLHSESFSRLSKYIAHRMNKSEGRYFRAYMLPHKMPFAEFKDMLDSGKHESLNELGDVVHLDAFNDQDDLLNELISFLDNEGNARRFYVYVKFCDVFKVCTGFLSSLILMLCLAISYVLVLCYFLKHQNGSPIFLSAHNFIVSLFTLPEFNALRFFTTVVLIVSLTVPISNILYLLRNGFLMLVSQFAILFRGFKSKLYFLITYFGFIMTIALLVKLVRFDFYVVFVSIMFGFCLDGIRRLYYSGRRGFILRKIDKDLCTKQGESLDNTLLGSGNHSILNALRLPYTPSKRSRVFISYTHSCAWSRGIVDVLYDSLSKKGIISFVDKYGIARGSSWRRALHEKMSDATHVICVASKAATQKEWPAAEIESALKMRTATGAPSVIVLLPEDLNEDEIENLTVIYKEVFLHRGDQIPFVRTIRDIEGVVPALSNSLSKPNTDISILGSLFYEFWHIIFAAMEFLAHKIKEELTILLGISCTIYVSIPVVLHFSEIKTLEITFQLFADQLERITSYIMASGFCLPIFALSCYLISTEITNMLDNAFWINHKHKLKSIMISQIIVLLVSIIFVAKLFSQISYAGLIFGFIAFVAGIFLTAAANKTQVETIGRSYYRNDSNKEAIKPPPLNQTQIPLDALHLLSYASITKAKEGIDNFARNNHVGEQIFDYWGRGTSDIGLLDAREKLLKISLEAEKYSDSMAVAIINGYLGDIAAFLGRYGNAIQYYRKNIANMYGIFCSNHYYDNLLIRALHILARLYDLTGDIDMAKRYARIAINENKTLNTGTLDDLETILYK
jgi:hypothetical protein